MPANFPLEVWEMILCAVGHVDGALETKVTTQFEWIKWRKDQKNYAKSMADKRSLTQVCKMWYKLAMKLLYEDIRIPTDKVESLCAILCASDLKQSDNNEHGNGWWTKRLDLDYMVSESTLHDFLAHFPNLRALRFPNHGFLPVQSMVLLPKLRCTYLQTFHQDDPIPPHLDTFCLLLVGTCTYTFSNLTALEVRFGARTDPFLLLNCSFPNIRHLTITSNSGGHTPALRSFLERYGPQLLSLNMQHCPADLLPLTPNIKELIIRDRIHVSSDSNLTFPNVTHVGILLDYDDEWRDAVQDSFLDPSRFPNVKCIQLDAPVFLLEDDPIMLEEYKYLYRTNGLVQKGVRFEDVEGNTWLDMINNSVYHQATSTSLKKRAYYPYDLHPDLSS